MSMDDNLNLFSLVDEEEKSAPNKKRGSKLDVVEMEYKQAHAVTWQELFEGFDTIHAITFSSGLNFVYQLLDMFDRAEIIFGCEHILSSSMNQIIAYQDKLIERMREQSSDKMNDLLVRMDKGEVRFYVSRGTVSHEKLYLLEAADGRKRVITGSANMSYHAFGGMQRENICFVDGDEAYDWYYSVFQSLLEESSDEITTKALQYANAGENIDELPIAGTIKANKVFVIEPTETTADDASEVKFILDVHNLADKLKPYMPKQDKKTSKQGKTIISAAQIVKLRRQIQNEKIKEKELRSEYPQLIIDADKQSAALNGEALNLHPTEEEIRHDVGLFRDYMDGYSRFHGDYEGMQYRYFEFANWFFCSPLMATMRDMAARFDQQRLPYPVFGLVYGQSKAGKTSFLETLLKMMIGQKPKISAPDFTRSGIENLKRTVQGAPIIVDDLTNTRFNQHAIETIKNDDFGVSDHLTHYSAVVISANEDVKAVAPEVIRRTVICRVEAGLTNTEVMRSNVVRSVQQKIGTAFYREYLRRMLEQMPELLDQLKDDENETPDILQVSSEVIVAIMRQFGSDVLPDYIRTLSLENYFSEHVTGKYAIKLIQNAWRTSKKSFVVNKHSNELRYNAGVPYEADRLMKELPETLEAHKSREWVVMNLQAAREFFDVNFRKGLWRF